MIQLSMFSVSGSPSPLPSSNDTGQTENTGVILPTLLPIQASINREVSTNLLPTPSAHDHHIGYQNRSNGKKGSQVNLETTMIETLQTDIPIRGGKFIARTSPLSRGDSPASPSATPDEGRERQMTATSGRTCLRSSGMSDPSGSSLKTCVASLLGTTAWYSRQCALTWKAKVTKSKRLLFQLSPSVRPTGGTGSGSSATIALTPTASEAVMDLVKFKARMEKYPNGTTMPNLATQVDALLLTPNVMDSLPPRNPEAMQRQHENNRPGRTTPSTLREQIAYGRTVAEHTPTGTVAGRKLRLAPAMCQWMMGYPESWTEFPCLEPNGDKTV